MNIEDLNESLAFAKKYLNNRNYSKAEKLYKKILKKFPNNFDANYFIASINAQENNFVDAKEYMEKALSINPNVPELNNNLGLLYFNLNQVDQSLHYFQKAIELNKNYLLAYINLAMAYVNLNNVPEAKKNYIKALEIKPNNLLANYNFANLLKRLSDHDNAEKYYKKAIEINPNHLPSYNNIMDLYDKSNQNIKLTNVLSEAEKIFKDNEVIKSFKSKVLFKEKKYDDVINILKDSKFENEFIIQKQSSYEVLAKSYDKIGNYSEAFKIFQILNNIMDEQKDKTVNKNIYVKTTQDRINFFANQNKDQWKSEKIKDDRQDPYFLIGFPRSGTTLLDTILRSHPSIEVLEEIPIINRFIDELYINKKFSLNDLGNLNPKIIEDMRNFYFNQLDNYKKEKNKKIIIDKMPLNIVHAGEIIRFFPNAKFILALRHPFDCVLSCFMQNFMLNHAMANFLNLNDASKLYDLTMQLWIKYINLLDINYHQIKYEDVIGNFENSIKGLLDFLDLPWSEEVNEFYKTAGKRGIINTPSYNQVSQPLYSNSMYRWKKYEKEFKECREYLDPWVKKFNYNL